MTNHSSRFIEMFEGDKYQKVRLGDYTDLTWGDTNTTKNSYVPDGYLAFSAGGPDGKLDHYDYDREGIVLSAIGADCGKTWYTSGKWSCIKNTIRFWSTSDSLDNYFLFLATRDKEYWPRRGGAQPFIPQTDARNCLIPLPPLSLQRQFISLANLADKSKFNGFKSRFIEQFGNMKKTPLSELASNWDKGQSFKKECIVDAGNTRCIHYGELFKYGPIIDTVLSSTNELPLKKSVKGDILFPASDVTPTGLARCSAIMCDDVLLGGDIIILRLNKGYLPEFVSYAINMQKEQLIRRVTGSVVRHMSAKGLRSVEIPIPTIEDQNIFVRLIRKADKSKYLN